MALKILLADDSMTAQNMGKKILVDAGYEVVAVSNGAAAIKKISSERPDIAILDEYMPGYTGSEVCERVKASAETSKIPVLLTVGKMEPFDQAKANKVRADGVMIKPFEASDLIAAVQSIAQKLLAPAPTPRTIDATVQLRGASGRSIEDTLRVPPPIPDNVNHEDTLRLTAEQIKAFQDASYQDWARTAEPHLEEHEKPVAAAAPAAELPVSAPVLEEEESTIIMPAVSPEGPDPSMPALILPETSPRETPVFNAMAVSGVAAEHEIFNGSAPVAPVHEPAAASAAVFYTPPVLEEAAPVYTPVVEQPEPAEPASVFSVQPVVPEPVTSAVEEITVVEPMLEPVVEAHPVVPVVQAAPVLETSAPLTPGPVPVETAPELEPTIAPAVEVAAAPANELEITSPPQEHGGPVIAQDAALITEADDMSEFVTKFGVEGAEPVHVGVAGDLPEEQLAAIVSPIEEAPVVAEPEIAPEPETAEEPAAIEPVTPSIQMEAPASPIEQQVGTIHAVEPVEDIEPVVAYVPPADQTQTFTVPRSGVTDEPIVAPTQPAPVIAEPVRAEEPAPEPAAAVAEAVPEVRTEAPAEISSPHHEAVVHAVETALAAAAGTAVAGLAHVIHEEPPHIEAPVVHEAVPETLPEPVPAPTVEEPAPQHEAVGDAALAEELAAALSRKESEEHAKAAADAAAVAAFETAPAASDTAHDSVQGLTDNKLAEAVTRAFENLKPHLIVEILKELNK